MPRIDKSCSTMGQFCHFENSHFEHSSLEYFATSEGKFLLEEFLELITIISMKLTENDPKYAHDFAVTKKIFQSKCQCDYKMYIDIVNIESLDFT